MGLGKGPTPHHITGWCGPAYDGAADTWTSSDQSMVQGDATWGSVGIYFPSHRWDREVETGVRFPLSTPGSPARDLGKVWPIFCPLPYQELLLLEELYVYAGYKGCLCCHSKIFIGCIFAALA